MRQSIVGFFGILISILLTFSPISYGGWYAANTYNSPYGLASSPPSVGSPNTHWMFEDGSGTTITDEKGVGDITLSATCTSWASGGCNYDWGQVGAQWSTPNGTQNTMMDGDFSGWVVFDYTYVASRYIWYFGNGSAGAANYDFILFTTGENSFNKVRFITSNNTSIESVFTPDSWGHVANGTKTFIAYRYQRNGGAADNDMKIWIATGDCSNIDTQSTATGKLTASDATHESYNGVSGSGLDMTYYDAGFHVGTLYTDAQAQEVCEWVMDETKGDW